MESKNKSLLKGYSFYTILLLILAAGIWLSLYFGQSFMGSAPTTDKAGGTFQAFSVFTSGVQHHLTSSIGLLLLQILIILTVARIMGWVFTQFRQPAVIGEIVAGILLGPTLFGMVWPEGFNFLFPGNSLDSIELLSQFGLILFMFVVGMELSLNDIKEQFHNSLIVSHAGIFIPFILSFPVTLLVYPQVSVGGNPPFLPFLLFVGIAMSITAFPVLARIISDQRLNGTPIGKMALSTAAMGDISAWLFLAAIVAITQSGSMSSSLFNLLFLMVYLLIMFGLFRPLFKVMGKIYDNSEVVSRPMVGIIFILLIVSSYATELLSMHALFGAFIMGLIMPEDEKFRHIITQKIEDVSLMLFLPLFFVASGLKTQLGLIDSEWMWLLLALFTIVAVVGKVGGTYLAARSTGHKPKESLYLGAFMNTRGLMELVVLSIGLQLGVLPPAVYAVLVLMTIITTVMTQPLISFISLMYKLQKKHSETLKAIKSCYEGGRVLLSFGRPESGVLLLRVTDLLLRRGECAPQIKALHITPDVDISPQHAEAVYESNFAAIIRESKHLKLSLTPQHEISQQIERVVIDELHLGYDMLMVGGGINLSAQQKDRAASKYRRSLERRLGKLPVMTGETLLAMRNILRDKMDFFVRNATCSVGIFVDRDYKHPTNVLMLTDSTSDKKLLPYARTFAQNAGAALSILPSNAGAEIPVDMLRSDETQLNYNPIPDASVLQSYDFMIVSYDHWKRLMSDTTDLLNIIPSTVILNICQFNA